jgi:hypothetical protein
MLPPMFGTAYFGARYRRAVRTALFVSDTTWPTPRNAR